MIHGFPESTPWKALLMMACVAVAPAGGLPGSTAPLPTRPNANWWARVPRLSHTKRWIAQRSSRWR